MGENFAGAGIYLIQTFFSLYMLLLMLRFLLQASRADYFNPICQAIVRITDPPIKPLKVAIPVFHGVDLATIVVALIVQTLGVMLVMGLNGNPFFHPAYIAWSLLGLFSLILDIYFFALLIKVISSWIAPFSQHPALTLITSITDPICAPARKVLPPMGGIDLSIILVFVAINLIDKFLVIAPIARQIGVPPGLILGL